MFETEDTIQNYYWASKDNFIYIVTKEWDKSFKIIKNKEMEPLFLENIPYVPKVTTQLSPSGPQVIQSLFDMPKMTPKSSQRDPKVIPE